MIKRICDRFKARSVGTIAGTARLSGEGARSECRNDRCESMPANIFLLTHKCGNTYLEDVYKRVDKKLIQFQSDELVGQMPGPYIGDAETLESGFANIRCRNFSPSSINRLLPLINRHQSQFFLFVRHPASLFRSATSYHMRGEERWVRVNKYAYLDGKTLYQALHAAPDFESRLLVSMKHFGIHWNLIGNWINCYHHLTDIGANFTVVRTEDLFADGDGSVFDRLSTTMSHHGFTMLAEHLRAASPRHMQKLPAHSTGEFRRDPFHGYTGRALEMYNTHFARCQNFFYG